MVIMPSSMTHTYFGMDVYQNLSNNCKKRIENKLEYFKIFCQGSDPFMFYSFFIGPSAKKMKQLQSRIHREKTREFFLNIIKYIHRKKLTTDNEVMSYLYGNICHYYLDLYTHPFIIYKAGIFSKQNKNTYKYNALHQEIEYMIDIYFIKQREQKPSHQFKVYKNIGNITNFSTNLKKLIDESINQTYQTKNASKKYLQSIWCMKQFFHFLNYDPTGLKLKCYQLFDKISPPQIINIKELSYYNNYDTKLQYLNLEHKKWHYPWDKTKTFHTSFLDLYEQAKKEAITTIERITPLLEMKNLNINKLNQIFQDLSYVTGYPCKENKELKYFEF